MKKRIIALLMLLVLCFTLVYQTPAQTIQAAETETAYVDNWAIPDLLYGVTYGIYPASWNQSDLSKNISLGKLYVLIGQVRCKLVETDLLTEKNDLKLNLGYSITVEDVLNAFYTMLSSYSYPKDLGLENKLTTVQYMKQYGIYNGENGEQALTDRCSVEQALVIATRIVTYVYDTLDAASKGFLWKVQSGNNTAYLLGSIHVASYDIYPFSSTMLNAYQSSDALVVEANLYDQADVAALNELVYYTDGTTLKDHVSQETYQKTVELAALMQIPEETVALFKPWYAEILLENYELTLNSNTDINSELGIDMTYLSYAAIYQKPIYAIEGLKKQGMILDSFTDGLQEYLLNAEIENVNEILNGTGSGMSTYEELEQILQYWHDGNVEDFSKLIQQEDTGTDLLSAEEQEYYKEYQEKFLTLRDKGMAEYIDNLLKAEGSKTYFVIVGSAHYISDYSVIDRLKEMGYQVELVK